MKLAALPKSDVDIRAAAAFLGLTVRQLKIAVTAERLPDPVGAWTTGTLALAKFSPAWLAAAKPIVDADRTTIERLPYPGRRRIIVQPLPGVGPGKNSPQPTPPPSPTPQTPEPSLPGTTRPVDDEPMESSNG